MSRFLLPPPSSIPELRWGKYVAALYANGEQGAFYSFDKKNQASLFQNADFTNPVTAVEQTVGSFLDLSGRGNHATQATAGARAKWSARVNLLTKTEKLETSWAVFSIDTTITGGQSDFLGGTAAIKITAQASKYVHGISKGDTFGAGTFTYSVVAKAAGYPRLGIRCYDGSAYQIYTTIDLTNGSVVSNTAGTVSVTALNDGWYRISCTGTTTANMGSGASFGTETLRAGDTVQTSYLGDGVSGCYMSHPQVERGAVATPYQRVTSPTDYDTVGFPTFLSFDGVDDSYSTDNIDFTGTDKMTATIGFRSDNTSVALLAELSANLNLNPGAMLMAHNDSGGTTSATVSGPPNSVSGRYQTNKSAPMVLSFAADIALPSLQSRIDGDSSGFTNITGGARASFGNYPLFIGSRAGASLFLKGQIHSLIVRGAATSDTDLQAAERYTAALQGRTL